MTIPRSIHSEVEPQRFTNYKLGLVDGTLTFDRESKTITLLASEPQQEPAIIEQQRFTDQEFLIMETIFDQYPDYCPLAELLSAQSDRSLAQCRTEVMRALDEGGIDDIIRPVRNLLHRARIKLRRFGLDVRSIQETGYLLVSDRSGFKRR
ncbi:hypothetical protein [Dictyobacter arantiisoli]|uniref:OmpR/PhoB-type domain-containing protein n=1 Tax=Dictyobacter arantiisoli TaxID=2014874 RepID=A0A5A5TH54_9CHLR|nr:hypothetical protein [Dictyobacter arantiisoli]GCF10900.1 hypothetical protein KDI_44640 [Dictyobacter arantiisoli]